MSHGKSPIRTINRLLIANRGEIARRIMRTCRDLGIETVAVYSDADQAMPHAREADVAVRLPGFTVTDTYLRIDLILDAARATGADAIHPGYGFLSESAEFASAVIAAGHVWVGPPPAAIASMGSKIEAKARMVAANVPVLPDATVDGLDRAELQAAGERVGYPLLVKASAGGGGRGMRVVADSDGLVVAITSASEEAAAAFGDGTVFLERYIADGRHVEIQILADDHGTCVSLFERECSIQRRHQKIIEESPSPVVDARLRAEMGAAAVAAAQAVGYVGAGTVEFLLDASGRFSFLEMNTRLQVEHPVTEMVTGLDLVALQLAIAEGRELPDPTRTPALCGHAIEARIYAEDPANGYRPHTGTIRAFEIPQGPAIRVDSGIEAGSEISAFYDPMLAKVIAWGPSRADAARSLRTALRRAKIHGLVTNRDQLVNILGDGDFLAGRTDTGFLGRNDRSRRADSPSLAIVAAVVGAQRANRRTADRLGQVPSGWRNVASQAQSLEIGGTTVAYRFDRDGQFAELTLDGQPVEAVIVDQADDHVVIRRGLLTHRFELNVDIDGDAGGIVDVDSPFGSWSLDVAARYPEAVDAGRAGSLIAPMPGTVVRVAVAAGSTVNRGDCVVVIEAMKMQHEVVASADGVVSELFVLPGQQLVAGQALMTLTEPSAE